MALAAYTYDKLPPAEQSTPQRGRYRCSAGMGRTRRHRRCHLGEDLTAEKSYQGCVPVPLQGNTAAIVYGCCRPSKRQRKESPQWQPITTKYVPTSKNHRSAPSHAPQDCRAPAYRA
jgi:hypothetical protein